MCPLSVSCSTATMGGSLLFLCSFLVPVILAEGMYSLRGAMSPQGLCLSLLLWQLLGRNRFGWFPCMHCEVRTEVEVQDPDLSGCICWHMQRRRRTWLPSCAAHGTATLWMFCLLFPAPEQEKEKDPFNYGETQTPLFDPLQYF